MLCESISSSVLNAPPHWRRDPVAVRFATFEELREIVPPLDSEWLTAGERAELSRFRHPARLQSWRFGRLLAKQLLLETAPRSIDGPAQIEILSRDMDGRSIRPEIRVADEPAPWCLSIAHSDSAALAAVSLDAGTMVGVDLIQPDVVRTTALSPWFTGRERNWLTSQPAEMVAVCWGLKEAVYKACQRGETFVPRRIEILPRDAGGGLASAAIPSDAESALEALAGNLTCCCGGLDLTSRVTLALEHRAGHVTIAVALRTTE